MKGNAVVKNKFFCFLKFTKSLIVIVSCSVLLSCILFEKEHPVPDNLEQRIKGLCEQYPPPSDFVPFVEPREIIKSDRGNYGGWYSSFMNPKDIIAYYDKMLTKDNWTFKERESYDISSFEKTRYITFEKDGFYISLEFADDKGTSNNEKRIYGMNCGFRP